MEDTTNEWSYCSTITGGTFPSKRVLDGSLSSGSSGESDFEYSNSVVSSGSSTTSPRPARRRPVVSTKHNEDDIDEDDDMTQPPSARPQHVDVCILVGDKSFWNSSTLLHFASPHLTSFLRYNSANNVFVLDLRHCLAAEFALLEPFLQPHSSRPAQLTYANLPHLIKWFHDLNLTVLLEQADELLSTVLFQHEEHHTEHHGSHVKDYVRSLLLLTRIAVLLHQPRHTWTMVWQEWNRLANEVPQLIMDDLRVCQGFCKCLKVLLEEVHIGEQVSLLAEDDEFQVEADDNGESIHSSKYPDIWITIKTRFLPNDLSVLDQTAHELVSNPLFPFLLKQGMAMSQRFEPEHHDVFVETNVVEKSGIIDNVVDTLGINNMWSQLGLKDIVQELSSSLGQQEKKTRSESVSNSDVGFPLGHHEQKVLPDTYQPNSVVPPRTRPASFRTPKGETFQDNLELAGWLECIMDHLRGPNILPFLSVESNSNRPSSRATLRHDFSTATTARLHHSPDAVMLSDPSDWISPIKNDVNPDPPALRAESQSRAGDEILSPPPIEPFNIYYELERRDRSVSVKESYPQLPSVSDDEVLTDMLDKVPLQNVVPLKDRRFLC